jgi:preprotein translocase subunit SecD
MPKALRLRAIIIAVVMAVGMIYIAPTIFGDMPEWWGRIFPTQRIRLGLDLKGGIHLVLGVQVDKAVENATERVAMELGDALRRQKGVRGAKVRKEGGTEIIISLPEGYSPEKVRETTKEYAIFEIVAEESREFRLRMRADEVERIKRNVVDQGRETIANRIDQFGVSETTVRKQGKDRILVELPGVQDPRRAIELIGKTALLEFKLVEDEGKLQRALEGVVPPGTEILYQKETGRPFLINKRVLLTGDYLTDARVDLSSSTEGPAVSIDFDRRGARLFSMVTEENVRRRMAIILDDNVYSAPEIREKIPGGRARVSGSFTVEEATDLAIVLRAGSLPAPVEILENRTIGPSLGADLIRKGIVATLVGSLLVIIFMAVYYKFSGLLADLALMLNLFLLMAALAGLQAALTLPGIAGIVLTMGIAVDANVLIFERIREELRLGRPVRGAIETVYARAFTTILDANVTTILTAVVLWFAGTGPIKGFATTLIVGIAISMFTALVVTRFVFDYITLTRKVGELSI